MERELVAARLNTRLRASERAIDDAILATAALIQESLEAAREVGVSPVTSQSTLAKMTATLESLQAARGTVVVAHKGLHRIAKGLNVKMVGLGGWDIKLSVDDEVVAANPASADVVHLKVASN